MNQVSMPPRLLLLLPWILASCGAAPGHAQAPVVRCPPCDAPPTAIHWVRTSAEYAALCLQVFGLAAERIAAGADKRQKGTWAVVMDADETVLDNSSYQLERHAHGEGFSKETWSAWVKRRQATAVPGAVAFTKRIRELGGLVAIVTNRTENDCPDTKANLEALGALHDVLLCKADAAPGDKGPRWQAVSDGRATGRPVEIVAYLGDNIYDFPGLTQDVRQKSETELRDFGAKFFVLPNPMYGSWESNVPR